ncbi:type IX secretion system sortase PorU [Hymenobacter negativus]|uniref:Type IX secretion system sortase PorU n=1 Tax=Hymenobacter negativus TaxID=2795026 RepID=A0ABS3QKQ0_9BACT|nr:type IX secretion system sortase PorU [Hymenobacter negativus]MBO2011817.1 type IX secretion system sortase PorU [Hymenobacter negativus]
MRPFFLFVAFAGLLLGAARPVQAQPDGPTIHRDLKWGSYGEVVYPNGRKQKVPVTADASTLFNDQVGWISQRLSGAAAQGQFTSLKYEVFPAADARLYDASKLPADPEPQLITGIEAKRPVTFLRLRPVRRNPQTGQPERLMSFDYSYEPSSGTAARGTASTRFYASQSVLNQGSWYKMGVAESGIYKLDKTTLSSMGVSLQGLNPNNLHVFGNSMGILPQPNATKRPDDLVENNIMFVGNADSNFDDNEYFLFYSPGAHTWEALGGVFRHRNNIYTDTTYYFVKVDAAAGRRVTTTAPLTANSATANVSTFTYRDFHEYDLVNLLTSGRNWAGEGFRNNGQLEIGFGTIPDLVSGSQVKVVASVLASASTSSSYQFTLNGAPLGSIVFQNGLIAQAYYPIAKTETSTLSATLGSGTDLRVGMTLNSGDPGATGYLDYLEVNAERQLRLAASQLEFRSLANIAPGARKQFTFTGLPVGAVVWDVTDPRRPMGRSIVNSSFIDTSDTLREYVAFQPTGSFKTPRAFTKTALPNQNLHSLNSSSSALLDLIIVTYPAFKAQAQRLADYRTRHDNLRTKVVTTTEVYNEYGSGGQDVTAIRDFMKQLYDRDNRTPSHRNLSLLLFGDASFDYKSDPYNDASAEPTWWRNRVPFKSDANFDAANQNYVPTYESRESLAAFYQGASYSSDDYYALLDDTEGEWVEGGLNELMDIAVGRLPVRTPKGSPGDATQAQQIVDKIISYDATTSFGKWRNRITLMADDGDANLFINNSPTALGSDALATIIGNDAPVYNLHKVYLDLYPQISVAAGQRSPDANRAIDQSIEQGSLIVNYLGHGGPKGLADEQIVTNASVMALRNPNNLTFLTTGTCDFSTYDNPDFVSAGEQVLTDNTTGGAVGLFTTTRVVEATSNAGLVKAYFNRVLHPINGIMPSIGYVVMLSKNDYLAGGINNRNYSLLADPSMTLAYSKQTVILDSIRQRNPANTGWDTTSTFKALARIRLHGRVLNGGALNTSFTGRAQVTIYDKPTTVRTLGNEPVDAVQDVTIQESVIYGGQANVVNGEFFLTFVVPKDINYKRGMGKISLYASDASHVVDANGYQLKAVGGAMGGALADSLPPRINLFMDNRSFVFGGLTAQNSTLLADLSDESGINTTGAGIGHDITATLDNDPNKVLVLNESYVSNVGDFTSGSVNNLFKDLALGPHMLRLKAWDTYNNSAEKEIEFMVAHDEKLALDHVLNYPNPFANSTTFLFDHNQADGVPDNLDVQVQIFTVAGHLVRTLNATVSTTDSHQKSITWNGRDEYDDQLARGVYVYRLSVRSQRNNTVASKYEKLVILN